MAKDKKGSKAAAVAPKPATSKPLESVKAGRVSKPVESSKNVAKKAAKEVEKKKKKVKEPTPEPSSESEGDDDTSDSSASSDAEDDSEVETKAQPKTNGKIIAAKDASDDSDSSSASDSDDEAPKVNGKSGETSDSDDSSETSDSGDSSDTSDSDSNGGVDAKAGAAKLGADAEMKDDSSSSEDSEDEEDVPKAKTNGKAEAMKEDDSGASDSDDSEDDSEDDSDSEEEDVKPKQEEPSKKRKAEETVTKTPKKTKVMVEGEEKEASANLFIGNLSWNVDEEWLTREFEEYGEIKGVRIITDRESGRSKGFGYVEFTDVSNAVRALEEKTGAELDGRNIRIDFSLPRPQKDSNGTPQQRSNDRASKYGDTPSQPSTTLFVGNIPFDADESALTEAFQDFGNIKSVRIPTDRESGEPKGFGYVEFDSIDEAKAAHEGMTGQAINGRTMRLDFAGGRSNDSPRGGFGGRGGGRGRGGFDRGGRGGGRGGSRGGFGDRGRGDRGRGRGGFNRGGFGDFSGKKTTF